MSLKNQIIDFIIRIASRPEGELANGETIDYVFEHTSANSPLRRLLIDQHAFNGSSETTSTGKTMLEWLTNRPNGFTAGLALVNLMRLPRRLPKERAPFEIDASQYYEKDELAHIAPHALENIHPKA